MKTLIIDNYDSFTHILAHLIEAASGVQPTIIKNDAFEWDEIRTFAFDNIVISPGPGRPDRTGDFGVSRDAIAYADVPLLGVCLGHQGLSSFFEGPVERAAFPMHGRASPVFHDGAALFDGIPSPFNAGRYHSLVVREPLAPDLKKIAWTDDGVVMALERLSKPQWGVQFHPESILTEHGPRLIENFNRLTRATRMPSVVAHHETESKFVGAIGRKAERFIHWRELIPPRDMAAVFFDLMSTSETAFWLDSADTAHPDGRWSYFGDAEFPGNKVVSYETGSRNLTLSDGTIVSKRRESVIDYLKDNDNFILAGDPPPSPFKGGHVGWFGYEMRNECGAATEREPATPDAFFVKTASFLAYDHRQDRLYSVSSAGRDAAKDWFDQIEARIQRAAADPACNKNSSTGRRPRFYFHNDRDAYIRNIETSIDRIFDGESYQICLTNEIGCDYAGSYDALYREIRRANPAPFGCFIKWDGGAVLSASPERFLSVNNGQVSAKPIKGTIKRSADATEDRKLAAKLAASEKDRSENIIIVDLLRNDLAKVCRAGSVAVPKLCDVESFATVHQLVSTIKGTLRAGKSATDLLVGAFPGGSMTGAPKLRTMQIIDALEKRSRGVYSGAIGWIGFDGDADLSIAIRTVVAVGETLSIGVGGGVIAMSDPATEFEETMLKAEASIAAIMAAAARDD